MPGTARCLSVYLKYPRLYREGRHSCDCSIKCTERQPNMRASITVTVFSTVFAAIAVSATCPSAQPVHLCCRNVAPWSSNSGVWGGICGVTPADPNTPMGGACISNMPCPGPTIEVCCSSVSPCGSGGLGNNCTRV
ncbi:hypothetical protein BXZ70DRAFT_92564 [Cristinia sonorae]|uniref:Uncharacterized protein n=1 Tax=Cristinia sonorae TaxID=1940300 RepID=A0A8K0US47_9AGAR|nr:hypothetical protein BXZ70DRAFT_92564 [Cristinia sonorae]